MSAAAATAAAAVARAGTSYIFRCDYHISIYSSGDGKNMWHLFSYT